MKNNPLYLLFAFILVSVFFANDPVFAQATCTTPTQVFKMATLVPEGGTVYKGLVAMKEGIKAKTGGCVDMLIFAGGTMGDETDVIKKIRIGQLSGGAVTGRGLSEVEPEVRILELPFLFKNENQIDHVYGHLRKYFEDKLAAKGFVLLGWAEAGLVQIFSTKPIATKKDLEGSKMWIWTGDEFAQAFFDVMKIVPIPLAVADVLTSLQTGLIDACYGPPNAALGFQWQTKAKNMSLVNIVNATGGIIVSKASWDKLNPAQQTVVKQVVEEESKKLVAQTRIENKGALEALKTTGVNVIQPTPESMNELLAMSKEVQTKLVGKFYPQALLDQVNQLLAQSP